MDFRFNRSEVFPHRENAVDKKRHDRYFWVLILCNPYSRSATFFIPELVKEFSNCNNSDNICFDSYKAVSEMNLTHTLSTEQKEPK